MKKIDILIAICLFSSIAYSQTSYYVNGSSGNDANNGKSISSPWKTLQKAFNSATPNSIVYIEGGTYHENDTVGVSGTAGNPITFTNYMNDSVYLDGTGTGGTTMLYMLQKSYLNFRGIVIQNLTVNNAIGIIVDQSNTEITSNISFTKIIVRNINWTSNASAVPNANDNAQGIEAYGGDSALTNLTIDSCYVYSNILGQSEAISVQGNVNGFSVTNCLVYNNTNIGIDCEGNYGNSSNPATDHARNGLISRNICFNDFSNYATSGGIYIDGGWNITIERNECYQNGYGIEAGCEQNGTTDSITIKNNILFNNQEAGLAIGGYTTATTGQVLNCLIRNNTFFENNYSNDGSGEIDMTKASNSVFMNNVFYTNSQNTLFTLETISPQNNNSFTYNCWFTPNNDSTNINVNWDNTWYGTFNSYRTGASEEAGSEYANPLLADTNLPMPNLHLTSGSPCINKGNPSTVISPGETDFDGNPRISGGKIDQGAYQYVNPAGMVEINPGSGKLVVYPVPATLFAIIEFEKNANYNLEITDAAGNLIKDISFNGKTYLLQRGNLAPGIYIIRVYDYTRSLLSASKLVFE